MQWRHTIDILYQDHTIKWCDHYKFCRWLTVSLFSSMTLALVSCHFQSPLRNQRSCQQPTVYNDHIHRQKLSINFRVKIKFVCPMSCLSHLSVGLSVCLSVCLTVVHFADHVWQCLCLFVCLHFNNQSIRQSLHQSDNWSLSLSFCIPVSQSVSETASQTMN